MTIKTAEWQREAAKQWIGDNPQIWEDMKQTALMFADDGRRFSMRYLAQLARFNSHVRGEIDGFKMNNSITPMLARILAEELPQVRDYIEFRKSKVDLPK